MSTDFDDMGLVSILAFFKKFRDSCVRISFYKRAEALLVF